MHNDTLFRAGRIGALTAAPLAAISLVLIITAEATGAMRAMNSPLAIIAGIAGLLAVIALLLGLLWAHLHTTPHLHGRGGVPMLFAVIGAALTAGAAWSLVFVAPALDARFPGLNDEPLPAVVAGYLLSHTVLGIGVLLWAIIARRVGAIPRRVGTTLAIGGLICIAPLPARYIVVAVGLLMLARSTSTARNTSMSTA